jgi:hypothetical protein
MLSDEEALELAKCVIDNRPTKHCPVPFSLVSAARHLAKYVINLHEEKESKTIR